MGGQISIVWELFFYELLTGRRPFTASSSTELMERIANNEPKPPRQVNDAIPKQLERICLKAIARLAKERYTTARDFAEDLQEFLMESSQLSSDNKPLTFASNSQRTRSSNNLTRKTQSTADRPAQPRTIHVVPKGPQAFDRHDADFFLELLPGPYDRNGVPESIRFWKSGIEDTENPFQVGLIYGPSGAGKSSFLQAGLLPLLDNEIKVLYVSATSNSTESTLLNLLKKSFPKLPQQLNLQDSIKTLRRGDYHGQGVKTLIILDQFEQWLAHRMLEPNLHTLDLVQSLRHCDGHKIQCLITIRDDFWMAITRFFDEVEIELVNGFNTRSIERFDLPHAKSVLHRFGVAFNKLPENRFDLTKSQESFLENAVSEFAINGKVASVAIALLAEMLKQTEWTDDTIEQIGGVRGLGLAYLEQYFDGPSAPPQNRVHEKAVREVLKAMLPLDDTHIKGTAISRDKLAKLAGYDSEPEKFSQLTQILENRLITPTEDIEDSNSIRQVKYQLAHDFFVPAIRDWISTSQQRTAAGRAEFLLEQRTRNWRIKPENQRLPGPVEFSQLVRHTRKSKKSPSARAMMSTAWKYYLARIAILVAVAGLLFTLGSWFYFNVTNQQADTQARTLVSSLYAAPDDAVPYVLSNLEPTKANSQSILQRDFNESASQTERFRAAIALAQFGEINAEFLLDRLASANRADAQLIVDAFTTRRSGEITALLNKRIEKPGEGDNRARLALLRADLTDATSLLDALRIKPDSTFRSQIIAEFSQWDHDWQSVGEAIATETDRGFLSGMLQAMALVEERVSTTARRQIVNDCIGILRTSSGRVDSRFMQKPVEEMEHRYPFPDW